MAAINGTKGAVDVDILGAVLKALCNRWNATLTRETADITPFSPTSNARVNLGGLYSMSGTVEGFLDSAIPPEIAATMTADSASASFVLTATTGRTYTFNGIISDFSPSVEVGVPTSFSANFVSDGAVTIA